MLDLSAIGSRVRSCREASGLTRDQFSEMINVTPRFLYDIELGNKGMSLETLINIGSILNVSTDYLLLGTSQHENSVNPEIITLINRCSKNQQDHLIGIMRHFVNALNESNS